MQIITRYKPMIINLKQSRLPRKTNLILAASINSSTASLMPKIIYKYKSCLTSNFTISSLDLSIGSSANFCMCWECSNTCLFRARFSLQRFSRIFCPRIKNLMRKIRVFLRLINHSRNLTEKISRLKIAVPRSNGSRMEFRTPRLYLVAIKRST